MSTGYIDSYVSRFIDADQVHRVRIDHAQQVERIRADINLSDQGKRSQIASATLAAKAEMAELRTQYATAAKAEQDRLSRTLFGPGTTVPLELMAHRDAFAIAGKLQSQDEALALIQQAMISGDVGLSRAVAYVAHQNNWSEALGAHDAVHPGALDKVDELDTIKTANMHLDTAFRLTMPKEFESFAGPSSDHSLETAAGSEADSSD